MTVLLRRAKLLFALAEAFDLDPRSRRERARRRAETGRFSRSCVLLDTHFSRVEQAQELAKQCATIATTIGGPGELREACEAMIEGDFTDEHTAVNELVPEPGATVRMQGHGVVGP